MSGRVAAIAIVVEHIQRLQRSAAAVACVDAATAQPADRPTSAQPCGRCGCVTRRIAPNWSAVRPGTAVAHGGTESHSISSTMPTAQMSPFALHAAAGRTKPSY